MGLVAWSALSCSDASPTGPDGFPRGGLLAGVSFCAPGGVDLKLDLWLPDGPGNVRVPATLFLHGGAWRTGSRHGSQWLARLRGPLLDSGIAVATADYRLSPDHAWPAHAEDARCAIRFLRARADEFGIDPDRIGVWGESSGAHLASLVGTADPDVFAGSGGHAGFSSRAAAVVALFGPADLTDPTGWPPGSSSVFESVFGTADRDSPILAAASPVAYVTADDPPFLLVHGTLDVVVPIQQSIALDAALDQAGVESELIVVDDGDHGLTTLADEVFGFDPGIDRIAAAILAFFRAELL